MATGCGIGLLIVIPLLHTLLPTSDQLRQQAIDQANAAPSALLDKQLIQDLNAADESVSTTHQGFDTAEVTASLVAKWSDVLEFNVVANQGGGFEVITRLKPDGHFAILWQGQDIPPCEPVNKDNIPSEIAPYCMKSVLIDRSNVIRAIYTSLFNPHINSKGQVSF